MAIVLTKSHLVSNAGSKRHGTMIVLIVSYLRDNTPDIE